MNRPSPPFSKASSRAGGKAPDGGKGPSPMQRIVLFVGVFYLVVWPALVLSLLSLAVRGACLLPGVTGCESWLLLESALPAWAARSLGGLLLLAFALSFLVPAKGGGWWSGVLWSFRGVCALAPAVVSVAGMSVPVPFPVAWLVGMFQPGSLSLSLRLWALCLLLVGLGRLGWALLQRLWHPSARTGS